MNHTSGNGGSIAFAFLIAMGVWISLDEKDQNKILDELPAAVPGLVVLLGIGGAASSVFGGNEENPPRRRRR